MFQVLSTQIRLELTSAELFVQKPEWAQAESLRWQLNHRYLNPNNSPLVGILAGGASSASQWLEAVHSLILLHDRCTLSWIPCRSCQTFDIAHSHITCCWCVELGIN